MRYNHPYHQSLRRSRHPHRLHIASFLYLALAIGLMFGIFHTPLDAHQFLTGFGLSLYRVASAYAVSLVLALAMALVAVSTKPTEALLLPILDLAQSFPTFAVLPVLVFYFGASSLSVIIILVIAMVWPITFAIIGGVKDQRRDQVEAAQIFGARGWKFFSFYRWPMLRPHIMTGSIVSWGQAWDTIVGAEIIAHVAGAGRYLGSIGDAGNTKLLFLAILIYLLLIFSLNQIIWLPLLHRYSKYQSES